MQNEVQNILTFTAIAADIGMRVDAFLAQKLAPISRNQVQKWLDAGHVTVNGAICSNKYKLKGAERITVVPQALASMEQAQAEDLPLNILFEDESILVLNKPAGLVVHPGPGNWSGTLMNGILHHCPDSQDLPRAGLVHRLDADTSGVMVVAKTMDTYLILVEAIKQRTVARHYCALVGGRVKSGVHQINAAMGRDPKARTRMAVMPSPPGQHALTWYAPVMYTVPTAQLRNSQMVANLKPHQLLKYVDKMQATVGALSLVACKLTTGRTHQIRVHMTHIGHPVIADAVYKGRMDSTMTRQALHAHRLHFNHPSSGEALSFTAPIPQDFLNFGKERFSEWAAIADLGDLRVHADAQLEKAYDAIIERMAEVETGTSAEHDLGGFEPMIDYGPEGVPYYDPKDFDDDEDLDEEDEGGDEDFE